MTQFGMSEDDFQKYLKAGQWGEPIHKNQVLVDKDELAELRREKRAFESVRRVFEKQRGAMDALLAGGPISSKRIPSMGCNIKWK